jgi:hypothetical protein
MDTKEIGRLASCFPERRKSLIDAEILKWEGESILVIAYFRMAAVRGTTTEVILWINRSSVVTRQGG